MKEGLNLSTSIAEAKRRQALVAGSPRAHTRVFRRPFRRLLKKPEPTPQLHVLEKGRFSFWFIALWGLFLLWLISWII